MKTQTKKAKTELVIEFEQVVERGCGMDVHKETVVATVAGIGIKQETRTFSTFTNSLQEWTTQIYTHVLQNKSFVKSPLDA